MFLHIVSAKYIKDYKIEIVFSNGRKGIADLDGSFRGSVFEQLKDKEFFSKMTVDRDLETIIWPNGADFAPEFLYFKAFSSDPDLQTQFEDWGYMAEPNG